MTTTVLEVGIDCVDDFKAPFGSGTADVLLNPSTRMLRFPEGNPPPKGTKVCVTYTGLCPAIVLSQDSVAAAAEGQKGVIVDVTGLFTDQAQAILDRAIFTPEEAFTVADQQTTEPVEESPPTVPSLPTIPKIGTPIRVPVPKIPNIPKFPFPRGNKGSGEGPTSREEEKDEKGKHRASIEMGPQGKHRITDFIGSNKRSINKLAGARAGVSGAPNVINNSGIFPPGGPFIPRVFVP